MRDDERCVENPCSPTEVARRQGGLTDGERLVRLETSVDANETLALNFRKVGYMAVSIVAVSLGAIFTQLMLTIGAQNVIIHTLAEHAGRMQEIAQTNTAGETRLLADIAELRAAIALRTKGQ